MSADKLTLLVGGQIYGGWKSVSLRLGIEQLAGVFELAITERWPEQETAWNIPPGERCEIKIGDDTVITGYVDSVAVSYDASSAIKSSMLMSGVCVMISLRRLSPNCAFTATNSS